MKRWFSYFISAGSASLHTFSAVGHCCRYEPTCSPYFKQAVERHGLMKGAGLGLFRILRCAPWGRGGWDPVPPRIGRKED